MAETGGASRPARSIHGEDLVVIRAANPGPMTLDGTRSYVLGHDRVAIIDPGPDSAAQLEELEAAVAGRPVAWILLTHAHADHAGLAARAADGFGAPVAGSELTLRRLGLETGGRLLEDGGTVEIDDDIRITVLHTPGHSADHVCYLAEPGRALFSGDLVLGEGSSAILHPDGSVSACLASLARLIALRPASLLPGHGPPVDDANTRLAEYRRHRRERERQIRDALAAGAATVPEIRDAVYPEIPPELTWAADATVAAHLAALAERGEPVPEFSGFGASEESGGQGG